MAKIRKVEMILTGQPTLEGAGVHLRRGFGFGQERDFDPFLLFDDFSGDEPSQFVAGFPWHPHRGIETITYVLEGIVEHGDSMGNRGEIGAGDVQWMTAGSGIVHQEMPVGSEKGKLQGFQLWANLPRQEKMIAPRYRGVTVAEIPVIKKDGADIRVICGEVDGIKGPIGDVVIEPVYLDVTVEPNQEWTYALSVSHTLFIYLFAGTALFDETEKEITGDPGKIILFSEGDTFKLSAGRDGVRFLLVSGKPLKEPIAWGGPIVMNTEEELKQAFAEYRAGTFIK